MVKPYSGYPEVDGVRGNWYTEGFWDEETGKITIVNKLEKVLDNETVKILLNKNSGLNVGDGVFISNSGTLVKNEISKNRLARIENGYGYVKKEYPFNT